MKVLVVGGGGREHALAWKLASERGVEEVICAPGNPGTAPLSRNVDVNVTDVHALAALAEREAVDLTVVGNAVNVASRLEALSKERDCQIVMSADVASSAGFLDDLPAPATVNVRGVAELMQIICVSRGRDLPVSILASQEDDERPLPKNTAEMTHA